MHSLYPIQAVLVQNELQTVYSRCGNYNLQNGKPEYSLCIGPAFLFSYMVMKRCQCIFQNMNFKDADKRNLKQSETAVHNQNAAGI